MQLGGLEGKWLLVDWDVSCSVMQEDLWILVYEQIRRREKETLMLQSLKATIRLSNSKVQAEELDPGHAAESSLPMLFANE